eukprot:13010857-Alexandrium_andersonii.AAC.1
MAQRARTLRLLAKASPTFQERERVCARLEQLLAEARMRAFARGGEGCHATVAGHLASGATAEAEAGLGLNSCVRGGACLKKKKMPPGALVRP